MLDLKAKLAAAGLVSAADIAAAERKPNRPAGPRGHDPKASSGDPRANQAQPGPRDPHANPPGRNSNDRSNDRNNDRNNNDRNNRRDAGPRPPANNRANQPRNHQGPSGGKPRPLLDVAALQSGNKGEAYDAIRRAVDHSRLDPAHGIPGEHAEAFHFSTAAGQLSRLTLEPEARAALTDGSAGLIAFMSHHGLAHCVVPRPLAEAVHAVFPLWLRVLKDHPGAGQAAPRPEPATPAATPEATTAPPTAPTTATPGEPDPE